MKSDEDGFYRRWTTRREISAASGVDETNSHRVLKELEEHGLLRVERRERHGSSERVHLAIVNVDEFRNVIQGLKYKEICEKLVNGQLVKFDEPDALPLVKFDEPKPISLYYKKKKLKVLRRRVAEPSVPTVSDETVPRLAAALPQVDDHCLSISSQENDISMSMSNDIDIGRELNNDKGNENVIENDIGNINPINMGLKRSASRDADNIPAIDLDQSIVKMDEIDALEAMGAFEGGGDMGRKVSDEPEQLFARFGGIVGADEWGAGMVDAAMLAPDRIEAVEAAVMAWAKERAQYAPPNGVENFRLTPLKGLTVPLWIVDARRPDYDFCLKHISSEGSAYVVALTCGETFTKELTERLSGVGEYWLVDRKNKVYSTLKIMDDFIDERREVVDESKKQARLEKSQKALESFQKSSEAKPLTFAQRQLMAMNRQEKKRTAALTKPVTSDLEAAARDSNTVKEYLRHLDGKPITAKVMYEWYRKRYLESQGGIEPVRPTPQFLAMVKNALRTLENHNASPLDWLEWVMLNWGKIEEKFYKYRNGPQIHVVTSGAFFSDVWSFYQVPKQAGVAPRETKSEMENKKSTQAQKQSVVGKFNLATIKPTEEDADELD